MKKYKTWAEARNDGWNLVPCAFPTKYNYFMKNGQQKREDELIESE
jgi:hypothetical protein